MTAYVYCRYTSENCDIQDGLNRLYSSIQNLVGKKEFKTHVINETYNMDNTIKELEQYKTDVMKKDCPIVIAGKQLIYH